MGNKNLTIDIAKGIAIILVVYGHVIEHSIAPWGSQDFFLNPVFKVIYTFHMPLFVFISGYLMAGSLNRNKEKVVFINRCKGLLIPFISLGVLGIVMASFLNIIFGNITGRLDIAGELADQLFLKPSVWFLYTLFVLSGLLILSVKLEKRFGVATFAAIYFVVMVIPYNNFCCLYYIKWFYLFYLAGYFFNKYNLKISPQKINIIFMLASAVMFVGLSTCWVKNDYIYINKMYFLTSQYLYEISKLIYRYMMGFSGIFIIFYIGEFISKTRIAPALGHIGVYSLDIYIIQMLLLEGIYPRLIYKANIHLDFNSPLVLYIVAPLISMFFAWLCLLSSKYLIRKIPLLNKLLLGGRS